MPDANPNPDTDRLWRFTNAVAISDTNGYGYSRTYADAFIHRYTHRYTHRDSYGSTYADTGPNPNTDANTNPKSDASGAGPQPLDSDASSDR